MKKNIPLTCLVVLALSSASFANEASDETIDILSAEASETDMKEVAPTTPNVVEPAVTPSQQTTDADTNALSASITKQLSSILGADTENSKKETDAKLEEMVSSALLKGVNMGDLRSAVSEAMDDIAATQEEGSSEKIKQASKSLDKLVGESDQLQKIQKKEAAELETLVSTPQKVTTTKTEPAPTKQALFGTVTVLPGESLYKVALRVYGRGDEYLRLYNENKDTIPDPNLIHIGQVLRIP